MSWQQGGQYGQQPNRGYYNVNPPYGQQPQDDGQRGQYGQQPQYPGQPTYSQHPTYGAGNGSVQQPQSGYYEGQMPQRQPSNAQYPGQPQYQQQQQTYQYNPRDYAQTQPQPQPPPTTQYNPQNYPVRTSSTYSPQQYNPQHYSPAATYSSQSSFAGATSGPIDPYGYADVPYSPQASSYAQSPQRPNFSPVPSYSPQVPSHGYGYQNQQSPPPQQQYGRYDPPLSAASQPQDVPYPTSDWQPHPQSMSSQQSSQYYHQPASVFAGATDDYRPSPPSHDQSPSPLYHTTSNASLPSPPSNGPTPPTHAPTRSGTTGRHPQSRPLPGPPEPDAGYFPTSRSPRVELSLEEQERLTQEDLFQQVESAVLNAGRTTGHSPAISVSQPPTSGGTTPLFAPSSPHVYRSGSNANGSLSPAPADPQYSSDSDAEASAGLAMLQMAEEEDVRRRQSAGSQMRFSNGYGSQRSSRQQQHLMPQPEASDSDDYGGVDMSSFGGGYDVQMTYGGDPSALAVGGEANGHDPYGQPVSQHSSMRSTRRSNPSQSSQASHEYDYRMGSFSPFMPFNPEARVDAPGTGGLSQPSADGRRQSYDEGDEDIFSDSHRFPDEPPDIFYQPASTSYRPLPAVPGGQVPPTIQTNVRQAQEGAPYPSGPDTFYNNYQQPQFVPRSTSLVSHTNTPPVHQPLRSKTDAEERRARLTPRGGSQLSTISSTPSLTPAVDLPTIPGKRFIPSQLGAPAFNKCEAPWSLSSILQWLMQITNPEQALEIREGEIKEALVLLFTNKVPTMNIADAETLSNRVVQDMYDAETLMATEEWVKIMPGRMSGVIFQLTGAGCYAPTVHDHIVPGRCYSHHCQRTLKKVNLREQPVRAGESWAEFYKLKKEDYEGRDKRELERQHVLHEVVQTEDGFIDQLNVLRVLYRDPLNKVEPSIITPKRKEKFLQDVFGKVDAIKQANVDHLLPQLKYRQQEQGPFIVGFSDIFRQWIRKAKAAYIDYAGGFPGATFLVRQEIDRNIEFRNFIDRARSDKRSTKLGWDTFLKAPITRLQRYTLLLSTVLKTMKTDSEEKTNLKIAYDEVKAVTMECDARVAEMQRKVDLTDLGYKLALRSNLKQKIELNLDHFGREMIHRGDVQRMGDSRFTWIDSHVILFDHYLVIAKTVTQRTEQQGKMEKYDVSRLPIPMDLLILDSANDPAVQKSSYVKGITSVRDVTGRSGTPQDQAGIGRVPSNQGPGPQLSQTNTGMSNNHLQTVTSLGDGKDADRIMYPFRVKHLGRDTYTLFAPTEQARRDWANKIIEAKTKHAAGLYHSNSEPFKLRVMADSAFVYDAFGGSGNKSFVIKGTPVDRAIKEVEQRFKDSGRPGPICRARVNCATTWTTPPPDEETPGKDMVAVGTDYGVYISETDNPRGWTRAINLPRVTQLSVLEDFNLFLLISDKSLMAYHLDVVCPATGPVSTTTNGGRPSTSSSDSLAKAPKKISGSKDVGFFATGRMKERTLVFYKKRENLNSVFKVIEPIYSKSAEKKRGVFKRGGPTDFFREYDEFYIPAECNALNLFHSSLAVSTARGFEVLTLDKKVPHSVPDLRAAEVQNIAGHIKDQRALAMLRLSDQEYLLVYANCAVYINKHGEVSRSVILEFVGSAQSAALYGAYLLLFCEDFVEIRNALNGRLMQVIAGREIKCLDDGGSWSSAAAIAAQGANGAAQGGVNGHGINGYSVAGSPAVGGRTVKLVMQHPEAERTQVVVELLLKGSVNGA
ncbi:Rho guanine nucleotide exchange factor [Saxophila tyrrhenica]|uniref:Rho guanine nucleotide exchange factor n=1 Tax=Saxophila tyrrhenica TaxID=1690608 RepID=A0AAV9PBH8_9PEZI|nr:Rho guanine nucleotide exchange factor [Saxophila tyrrhenica]